MIAISERLAPARRDELAALLAHATMDEPLAAEGANVREQLAALWTITEAQPATSPR